MMYLEVGNDAFNISLLQYNKQQVLGPPALKGRVLGESLDLLDSPGINCQTKDWQVIDGV